MTKAKNEHFASAMNPHPDGMVSHLLCRPGDVAEIALLPGDPGRVKMFADLLDGFRIIAQNREYTVASGSYQGVRISICSTGIGGPSTEIACVELAELGVKAMIRIGGTGVLRSGIRCGDMVINTGAMRKGGASCFYAPAEYPALASFEAVDCLVAACRQHHVSYWTGISASVGSFFAGQGRPAVGKNFFSDDLFEQYKKLNILNMEMEAETIMTLGSLLNFYAGSICAVHANREDDLWLNDFEPAQKEMCRIALDASVLLQQKYLKQSD